jgi:Bacterial protein of unknown function (DUF885)
MARFRLAARLGLTAPLILALALLLAAPARAASPTDSLAALAGDFWAWRTVNQPLSGDDIPRLPRPAGWVPDWSPQAIAARRAALAELDRRWRALSPAAGTPIPQQVDWRLLGSALARVHWELDYERAWRRDPNFYLDQTLGAVFDLLVQPPPFDRARGEEIVRRMASIPAVLADAPGNLDQAVGPFARLATARLNEIRSAVNAAVAALDPLLPPDVAHRLDEVALPAIKAFEGYREWLTARQAKLPEATAVGRDAYLFFLRKVALLPFTPEEMLAAGRQEWERAVGFEAIERRKTRDLPPLLLFPDAAAQIAREARDEIAVRRFLDEKGLLTVPAGARHYKNLRMPAYLDALAAGVTDDLTSEARRGEDAVSYVPEPAPDLSYFRLATARDPRPILVHEGVPGHAFQLALSWGHEDPIRRHFYDSSANEGIGFYAEEMLLQAGFFDDRPQVREIVYSFMRLRALRVEVDVRLALGEMTLDQAADYLRTTVPMDAETAREEAASFASTPGQAISYQIGKVQILRLLAEARRRQGDAFDLRAFHDFVWKNGNVPLALQRWELLGLRDEVDALGPPL